MKILFNTIRKSTNYLNQFEVLFSDYALFRQKHYSNLCLELLQKRFGDSALFLTHSATGALEQIALLMDLKPGDEIILPSFTFVSSVNAFVSKGAIPVFVDIETETLNLDLNQVERAITFKTKAVLAVHYAGHACDLNRLREICVSKNIFLIEDAAMAYGNSFEGKPLGTIGDFGVISFDITKQITAIQGGLLLVNRADLKQRASNLYHIGTNRDAFSEGNVPYYEWVDVGSKFQMNELNASVLYDQLQHEQAILNHRRELSARYYKKLKSLKDSGKIDLLPEFQLDQNYHEFYVLLKDENERNALAEFLKINEIEALFHYIPLHNSQMGRQFLTLFSLENTCSISERLLRLPMHDEISKQEVDVVVGVIQQFLNKSH